MPVGLGTLRRGTSVGTFPATKKPPTWTATNIQLWEHKVVSTEAQSERSEKPGWG